MKKNILKHLTVTGFANSTDLSNCEILENNLNEVKVRFKLAKKDVKDAKQKLNQAIEDVINKIENQKKEIKETQSNLVDDPESSSAFNMENIKAKYNEAADALELRKNKIKKKIEEYNAEGTENWDTFKNKINHDIEELSIALKGFVTKSK
jgi:phosphoenolpyruvate-protein kinase (PTS system EI component)